ncbi:MAG: hypothetical protein JXR95_10495 [Deltaproteobacteria bacterium]|nr:hypothetical protein [Deltaproteobacteria bacterium]
MTLNVDWEELELACERNATSVHSYLDLVTGAVLVFYGESEEEEERRLEVDANRERYLKVEPASSREQYKWMEKFVSTVHEEKLKERLLIAIDGKGAFRRFKDLLVHFPGVRERWYSYRAVHLHDHINNWLGNLDLAVDIAPPWGDDIEIPDDEPIEPITVTQNLSPAEILRRQASELLDGIPAVDLPAAIAFLQFLKDKDGPPPV